MKSNIRNFSIIAHIDHGKSTLADRMLEVTKTIEKREMKDQLLDTMELERERGITIKMQPVSMKYTFNGDEYMLNMIDTPGHIDFSYEVSRALKAIEGCVLLVDSTQGVQAQTLSVLDLAKSLGIKIIPVLSKTDSPLQRVEEVSDEVVNLLGCKKEDILLCSGKTGKGVEELLQKIIETVSSPEKNEPHNLKALVFDSAYSTHSGVVLHVRLFSGSVKRGDKLKLPGSKEVFSVIEVGIFSPTRLKKDELTENSIGYIITGIKKSDVAAVGDTVLDANSKDKPLSGYEKPKHVIWASVYPESQDDMHNLHSALLKLHLEDVSFSFDEESSASLGKGFRCGFLGMLHLEIIIERIKREFNLEIITTTPTTPFRLKDGSSEKVIQSPIEFPVSRKGYEVFEKWVVCDVVTREVYLSGLIQLFNDYEAILMETESFGGDKIKVRIEMPLRELMRNFFDKLKSVTSGYSSISYKIIEEREANVCRLDLYIAEEIYHAFSKIVSVSKLERESKNLVEKVYETLPRQMFVTKIQAHADGRIIASKTLSALRKDVTAKLYGGDITRKMKLREKQKKGKAKRGVHAKIKVPQSVFLKIVKSL